MLISLNKSLSFFAIALQLAEVNELFQWVLHQTPVLLILRGAGSVRVWDASEWIFGGAFARSSYRTRAFLEKKCFCSPLYHIHVVGAAVKETQQGNSSAGLTLTSSAAL